MLRISLVDTDNTDSDQGQVVQLVESYVLSCVVRCCVLSCSTDTAERACVWFAKDLMDFFVIVVD